MTMFTPSLSLTWGAAIDDEVFGFALLCTYSMTVFYFALVHTIGVLLCFSTYYMYMTVSYFVLVHTETIWVCYTYHDIIRILF